MASRSVRKSAVMSACSRDKYFNISVNLTPTKEIFPLKKVYHEMKISELKREVEFATGIPYHMQRLHYLDEGELQEHTDIRHNDIIPGAVLSLDVWNEWRSLVETTASNDADNVLKLGVTKDTKFSTPNSEYLSSQAKLKWIADRAFTALFISAHRGYKKLAEKLIEKGADVNSKTGLGRTALHVASAQGHGTIVDLLLEKGADIDAVDKQGETALSIATKYGNKGCERHLFLFRWQQRAKSERQSFIIDSWFQQQPVREHEMFAHQYCDSQMPQWLRGQHGQIYYSNLLPPGEYAGSSFSAPLRQSRAMEQADSRTPSRNSTQPEKQHQSRNTSGSGMFVIEEELSSRSSTRTEISSGKKTKVKSFDAWLKRKQAAEQKVIDMKKQEEQLKRLQEEDRQRQEAEREKSYDQWLAEKSETAKRKTLEEKKKEQVQVEETKHDDKMSTAAIIQAIMLRRQQEAQETNRAMPALTYESWMPPDSDIIEDIRMGKTPLHRHLANYI